MLELIWNRIAYLGTFFAAKQSEQKHILLVNGLTLFLEFILLSYLVLILIFHTFCSIFWITGSFSLLLMLTLYLNSKGKLLSARVYLLVISFLYIGLIALLNGRETNAHWFFLSEILVIYFVFPKEQFRWILFFVTISLIAFITFDLIHDQLNPIIELPKEILRSRQISTNVLIVLTQVFFAYYIYNTFQKAELAASLEHFKSERLLQNILPLSVIKKLRDNPDVIAEKFDECTILFSDIVGFTEMSRKMTAGSIVSILNEIFSSFDDLVEKHKLEKIKTIGDAYMVVGGAPEADPLHAEKVVSFALDMLDIIKEYRERQNIPLEIRIGINSGDAIAGVIGKKKFIYDLWGESVNTASRMESHGLPGRIQVSESTYVRLKEKFPFQERGMIEIKGMGKVKSYIL